MNCDCTLVLSETHYGCPSLAPQAEFVKRSGVEMEMEAKLNSGNSND